MAVHHVEMDPVGAGRIDRADLFAEPEKSDARIDGAMTRGRGAKGWDMGACRHSGSGMAPRNMRDCPGQCGRTNSCGRKNLPEAASIAGSRRASGYKNPNKIWVFRHGTALAEMGSSVPRMRGPCWSSAMFPALGAASSAIDAAQGLTSTKPTAGVEPGSAPTCSPSPRMPGLGGIELPARASASGSPISPETMSALLAAQSQSGSARPRRRPAARMR